MKIDDHIEALFTPTESNITKPQPEFFEPIFERYGREKNDYLIIGNNPADDTELAKRIGIDSVLITTTPEYITAASPRATFTIDDLAELEKIALGE
jgi:FMN phosphatase YigB (HAD superfamily)